MNEPLVTVIIPVYNSEQYIERCIGSIQNNGYTNLEIICVNDGSPDNSISVLRRLAAKDQRIRVIDKPNGGVSSARNAGLDAATGEYVAFIDSDDWIHRDFFSMIMKEALKTNADITIANYREVYDDDVEGCMMELSSPETVHTATANEMMARDGYFRRSVWGRIYKRALIAHNRFPSDVQFGEDAIFNALVTDAPACRISHFDLQLYFYYQLRTDSLVHAKSIEANYVLGSWYIDHIEQFSQKNIAVLSSISALLTYRFEGSFSSDAKAIRKKAKKKLSRCLEILVHEIDCPVVTKIKYFVFIHIPKTYHLALRIADPSIVHYEKILKERFAHSEKEGM